MKPTTQRWLRAALWLAGYVMCMLIHADASVQGFTTTTVQGIVYLANGQPGSGSLQVSWPSFTTAGNQAVAAGRTNVNIGLDGYVSVNLAPNQGSTPAGLYYTAVYHLSDGTTSTEYWVVPAAAQANLSEVRAQVMPAAQAVHAVSQSYVDQSIAELTQKLLTPTGGTLNGPLILSGDPTQPAQAATKRYVDKEFSMAVPLTGGVLSGTLTSVRLGAAYQVDQFPGADFGARLQACLDQLDAVYGGTCDARNFSSTQSMGSPVVITTANATVQFPCATIATANQIQITAGTRNVTLHGCALRGASNASGSQGGTVLLYSGSGPMIQVGDTTYNTDTLGFHLDNVVINTTGSTNAGAQGLAAYRTQEMNLQGLYFLGNSDQTGMTLDGTGNYTGGTFQDLQFGGFGFAVNAIGHQTTNPAPTDWLNASTFVRLHINCPTSAGSPVNGTYGINLMAGDGNTFTGGDVEGCATALHLGPNAQNNTIIGLRNENSISQIVADAGSSYNNWITGGTMFTGKLTDNGTRNSFLDTFHRSFNSLNGDWYGSQQDATVTNHFRVGTGAGNERGLLNRYQTDYGYRWTTGFSDATAGEQFYQLLDELNNVYRLSIGQYNQGQPSTNNQTIINAAGTGAVVLNGSANAGTGGVIFGAGGSSGATVATVNNAGNAQFNGSLQVGGPSTFISSMTVRNQADAEIDSFLWAGATANQKESYIYKDYTGASQWYMVKDASNNWALNSAVGGLDSFKAYQSNNSGDTYINASNGTGHIRLNYETGSGAETDIYSGSSSALVAAFLGSTAIKFPGLAAASGRNCLQIDNSGYISNTGSACGAGGSLNGTVNAGSSGQVAYYSGDGAVLAGTSSVAVSAGGTGGTNAAQARQNLGAHPVMNGVASDGASGMTVSGNVAAGALEPSGRPVVDIRNPVFAGGAKCNGTYDDQPAFQAAYNSFHNGALGGKIAICDGAYFANPTTINWGTPGRIVELDPQGVWTLGSTLIVPGAISIKGQAGGAPAQFQVAGQPATIAGPQTVGTISSAVSTTGSPVTVSVSTTNGVYANTAITIADPLTCTSTALSSPTGIVTATMSGSCHMAPGIPIVVSGLSPSGCNGTFYLAAEDAVQNTLGWATSGACVSPTGTASVTGWNEDTYETLPVSSVGSGTITFTNYRTHVSGAKFGIVTIEVLGFGYHNLESLNVVGSGTQIWAYHGGNLYMYAVGTMPVPTNGSTNPTGFGFEMNDFYWAYLDKSNIQTTVPGMPYAIRLTNSFNDPGNGSGLLYMYDGSVLAGLKVDNAAGIVRIKNTLFEEVASGVIRYDPSNYWSGNGQTFVLDNVSVQDNFYGFAICNVAYVTPATSALAAGYVSEVGMGGCLVNDYAITGGVPASIGGQSGQVGDKTQLGQPENAPGFDSNERKTSYGPSLIPYATAPVNTNLSTAPGNCSVAGPVLGPDGQSSAYQLTYWTTIGCSKTAYEWNGTPAAGDMVVAFADVMATGMTDDKPYPGAPVVLNTNPYASNFQMDYQSSGTSQYFGAGSGIVGDWWHRVFAVSKVTAANGGPGKITFQLEGDNSHTMNYANWCFMYIPASANIPEWQVRQWAKQQLHGACPANMPAGVLAVDAGRKLYWGSDTNLYRAPSGGLASDQPFTANGFKSTASGCSSSSPVLQYDGTCTTGSSNNGGAISRVSVTTLASPSPTISVPIPAGYTSLYMTALLGTTSTSNVDNIYLYTDKLTTGSVWGCSNVNSSGTSSSFGNNSGDANGMVIGIAPKSGQGSGSVRIWWDDYPGDFRSMFTYYPYGSGAYRSGGVCNGSVSNSSTPTTLIFKLSSGSNFPAGSKVTLYGEQ